MNEYVNAVERELAQQTQKTAVVTIGKVTALNGKKAVITFAGETVASGKGYPSIRGFSPTVGDDIVLLKQGNSYVIIGKIVRGDPESYVDDATLNAALQNVPQKSDIDNIINGTTPIAKSTQSEWTLKLRNSTDTRDVTISGDNLVPKSVNQGLGNNSDYFQHICARYIKAPTTSQSTSDSNSVELSVGSYNSYNALRLIPKSNRGITVGSSTYQANVIYTHDLFVNNSAITSSDSRKKNTVNSLLDKFREFFYRLRPVTFKYNNGDSGRLHVGFIAQEVEQAMKDSNISSEEFAGLVIDEDGNYGLRYEEFIAVQTAVIQDLKNKVDDLERRLNDINI